MADLLSARPERRHRARRIGAGDRFVPARRCGDQPLLLAQHSDRRERVSWALELASCVLATVAVSLVPATITGLFYGRLEVSEELRDV